MPSLECLVLVLSAGDNLISNLSLNKCWILGVDRINLQSLGVDNDSSLLAYLTPGLMKPWSESSYSCFDNSFISEGANRYGARAMGATPGIKSMWNSTGRAGGRPGKSSRNTSKNLERLVRP
ncbi:hypothetical protein Tco_0562701 [Tanacetum coccineum]